MKKSIAAALSLLVLIVFSSLALADDISNNFKTVLSLNQDKPLDALAQDLGPLLAGGSFRRGRVRGFPVGFDVGANVVVAGVQKENLTLRDDGSTAASVIGQAEIGLPWRINAIARAGKALDGDVLGGGISLGLLKPSLSVLPSLSVSALYNHFDHEYVTAKNFSANAVLSIELAIIDPYIGIGYDYTTLEATDSAYSGLSPSVERGQEGKADGFRAEAGVNLHFIPFTYVTLGAGVANDQEMYHAGLGVSF